MGYIGGITHLLTIYQVPGTSKQVTTNKHTNPREKFMPLASPVWKVKTPWKLEVFMPRVYNCYDPSNQGSFSLNHTHRIHVRYICHYLPTFAIKINHMGYGEIVWDHNIWNHVKLNSTMWVLWSMNWSRFQPIENRTINRDVQGPREQGRNTRFCPSTGWAQIFSTNSFLPNLLPKGPNPSWNIAKDHPVRT